MRFFASVLLMLFVFDSLAQAVAQHWCAFDPKKKSHLQCGYSSPEQCRATVSPIGGVCVPDPQYAYMIGSQLRKSATERRNSDFHPRL